MLSSKDTAAVRRIQSEADGCEIEILRFDDVRISILVQIKQCEAGAGAAIVWANAEGAVAVSQESVRFRVEIAGNDQIQMLIVIQVGQLYTSEREVVAERTREKSRRQKAPSVADFSTQQNADFSL